MKSLELTDKSYETINTDIKIKELNLAYNKAKIKNDPMNYRLTDRIITYDKMDNSVYICRFPVISNIIDHSGLLTDKEMQVNCLTTYSEYQKIKSELIEACHENPNEVLGSCFSKDENMKIFLENAAFRCNNLNKVGIVKNMGKQIAYLFSKLSDCLVFLTTEKSIITELFLSFFAFRKISFIDLRELTEIAEDLKFTSSPIVIPILGNIENFIWAPVNQIGKYSLRNPKGERSIYTEKLIHNEGFYELELRRAYTFALEIMHYLAITNEELFNEFYDNSSALFQKLILDCQRDGTLYEDVPEERFNKIKTVIDYLDLTSLTTLITSNAVYLADDLQNLVQYACNFSYMNYNLKLSLLLIEYAKENKIEIFDKSEVGSSGSDEDDEDEDYDEDEDEEYDDTYSEGADYSYTKYNKLSVTKTSRNGKSKEISIAPTLLDKAIAKFSAGGYDFKIESRYTYSVGPDIIDRYNKIAEASKMVTNELIKQIKDIKCYNFGGKNSGKWAGKLDNKRLFLYKTQKNIFCDNTYKIKEMDPVFGIILDQSGSMSGSGVKNGRITMILLHEVLKSLGINHSIIGHTSTDHHQVTIFKYVAFKEDKGYTLNKAYNLVNMEAYDGNCDSGSLYYMEQQLLRTKQRDKICLIFSDGCPTECSSGELINQVKDMEARGIITIGIGINFGSIKNYYANYANGRNLKEMIDIVCKILKQYVLEKED